MAVRRVLAEADVREEDEVGRPLRERPERLLHDAVLVPGAGGGLVLLLRDPEEKDGADAEAEELLCLVGEPVDGALRNTGKPFERLVDTGARAGKQGIDEVAEVESRLADELPERTGAAEAPQAGSRKNAAHASNLRMPSLAPAPKAAARPTSQAASRARVPQGSLS